jgi:transposase
MRYQLTDHEWVAIKPMLPNKPRGVARVNDRRVLNGIFWVLRSGAPWRDLPDSFGPYQPSQSQHPLSSSCRHRSRKRKKLRTVPLPPFCFQEVKPPCPTPCFF